VSDEWDNSPEGRAYIRDFLKNGLPKIRGSAVSVSVLSSTSMDFDTKQATEIGAILLLGKPLILIVTPGAVVPPGLLRAADTVLSDWEFGSEGAQERLMQAVNELVGE
jgi:hypothetical protein